jgi:hypothetical protein
MKKRLATQLLAAAVLLGALAALLGSERAVAQNAQEARIGALGVGLGGGQLLVDFTLIGAFGEELQKRIDSGLPTSLIYEIELLRARRSWFEKSLASGELQVIAMYNALTREYLVNFKHDGNLILSKVVREPGELRQAMTVIGALPAFPADESWREEKLQLRVRAELGTGTTFFFIPYTVRTGWAETAAFRLRDLAP